jgi:hypothetical protein
VSAYRRGCPQPPDRPHRLSVQALRDHRPGVMSIVGPVAATRVIDGLGLEKMARQMPSRPIAVTTSRSVAIAPIGGSMVSDSVRRSWLAVHRAKRTVRVSLRTPVATIRRMRAPKPDEVPVSQLPDHQGRPALAGLLSVATSRRRPRRPEGVLAAAEVGSCLSAIGPKRPALSSCVGAPPSDRGLAAVWAPGC